MGGVPASRKTVKDIGHLHATIPSHFGGGNKGVEKGLRHDMGTGLWRCQIKKRNARWKGSASLTSSIGDSPEEGKRRAGVSTHFES